MRAVIQRVSRAHVDVGSRRVGAIGPGLVVLLGVEAGDTADEACWMAEKIRDVRIFEAAAGEPAGGRMDRSVRDIGGSVLVVSQFTLCGDCRKGRRPSFEAAAPPDVARPLYEQVVAHLRGSGVPTETGEFRAMMQVELVNDGPVTLVIDRRRI
jgi:D-tyrosyl-tRNA(Tyr) deacylase